MTRIDEYGRATTQVSWIAETYKVEDTRDVYVMKIPEAYKQKLLTQWLRVKLYHYDRPSNTYRLPPNAWEIRVNRERIPFSLESSWLYDYQKEILSKIRYTKKRAGFIVSWTATWKSYMLAWLIWLYAQKTLIVVPNISIARWLLEKLSKWSSSVYLAQWAKIQWAEQFDIVICHHTTFNTHYDYLNWLYGTLILDEGHHLPVKRIQQLTQWKWWTIFWLTATPKRKEFGKEWIEKIFGPIYYTWVEALPVQVYINKFRYDYSVEELEKASDWLSPDSNEIFRRLIMNNDKRYDELINILHKLDSQWYTKYIIFSDRREHIQKILAKLDENWYNGIDYYWGSDKNISEAKIKTSEKFVIVWHPTSCGEWFDVPSIEVSMLYVSTGREPVISQIAWRARRYDWEKKSWILVDFVDQISIMGGKTKSLSFSKRMKVYKELDWETTAL